MRITATETQRVALYLRISKDHAGDGHGIANQRADCARYVASRPGWRVAREFVDNDVSASNGKRHGDWDRLLAAIEAREVDVVLAWALDRALRTMADYVKITEACERAGVRLCSVSGNLDFSTDQGETLGGILAVIARGEVKRKGARQRLANQQAASAGKRATSGRRPFGYKADHVTPEPAEADAIRWAAGALLGGSTVSAVMREWQRRGLRPAQGKAGWSRNSVAVILRNPALAGLRYYHGEEVAAGDWTPILSRTTWTAVGNLLRASDRTVTVTFRKGPLAGKTVNRKVRGDVPRGVRTLLGGLARCPCGNSVQGNTNRLGTPVYRCNPATRPDDAAGPHCSQRAASVDEEVVFRTIERLERPDIAALLAPKRPDLSPLHTEAASIRRNLDELAADRALGLVSRSQMIAATERGNARLAEIAASLAAAAETSALAVFAAADSAWRVWDALDNSRKRAVIAALTPVTILPAGRGARVFNPATVITAMPGDRNT
jgi:DNA invertase Pin-like site-specific DNA recombinase